VLLREIVRTDLESPDGGDNTVVIFLLLKSSFIFNLWHFMDFFFSKSLHASIIYAFCNNQSDLLPYFPFTSLFQLKTVLFQNSVVECTHSAICRINVLWSKMYSIIVIKAGVLKLSSFCFGSWIECFWAACTVFQIHTDPLLSL
jgi:hypothetical protein